MIINFFSKTHLWVGLLFWAVSMHVPLVYAESSTLKITEVFVQFDPDTLTIHGKGFDFGPRLKVTLGDRAFDNDISAHCTPNFELSPLKIVCDLSDNGGLPSAGDYLLTVSSKRYSNKIKDSYGLTISPMVEVPPVVESPILSFYKRTKTRVLQSDGQNFLTATCDEGDIAVSTSFQIRKEVKVLEARVDGRFGQCNFLNLITDDNVNISSSCIALCLDQTP